MRFLVAFLAVLGYAAADVVAPVNAGDAQAAVIDANVAARDNLIAWNDAVRKVADTNREITETAFWNNVAANQDAVAVAQQQVAAVNAVVAARNLYPGSVLAPYGIASPYYNGLVTPYGAYGLPLW